MGINTLIFSQSGGNEGIGFSAPSNIVRAIYSQIRELGAMRRGEIGVTAQTVTPLLAKGLGLSRDWGVVLGDVEPGGPAHIAGLKTGDIVVSMDGKAMENARQFHVNLYQRAIGDVVKLEILREGKARTHNVAVLEREDDPDLFARLVSRQQNLIEPIGVLAIDLNRNVEKMLPPVRQSAGAVVAARVAEGPYWSELFEPGDVIYQVNRTPTPGVKELREALAALTAGDAVVVQLERRGKMQYAVFELE
jgi:serine protease Do